jgi:hypothetical protein
MSDSNRRPALQIVRSCSGIAVNRGAGTEMEPADSRWADALSDGLIRLLIEENRT